MAVQPVFLPPLMGQLTLFIKVMMLQMLQHLFNSCRVIDRIDLEEISVKIMGPSNPHNPLPDSSANSKRGRSLQDQEGV